MAKANLSSIHIPVTVSELAYGYQVRDLLCSGLYRFGLLDYYALNRNEVGRKTFWMP